MILRKHILEAIIWKEWKDSFRNKRIIAPVILLTILFALIFPLLFFQVILLSPEEIPPFAGQLPENFDNILLMAIFGMFKYILPMFLLLIPIITAMSLATYSFAGEKESKTIESLLLIPATDRELLLAKSLAIFIPAIIIGWLGNFVYLLVVKIVIEPAISIWMLPDLQYVIEVFLLGPLMTFLTIEVIVLVSSRASGIREAEQYSGIVLMPIIIMFTIQISGIFILGLLEVVLLTAITGLLDALLLKISELVFNREKLVLRLEK